MCLSISVFSLHLYKKACKLNVKITKNSMKMDEDM